MNKLKVFVSITVCLSLFISEQSMFSQKKKAPAASGSETPKETKTGENKRPPIIDIHVHSMKVGAFNMGDLCPWFLQSMPGTDPKTGMSFTANTGCVDPIHPAKNDEELQAAFIETINRLNITAVTFGDAEILHKWKNAAPDRIIPGIGFTTPEDITVQAMNDSLSSGFYKVMSEVAPQYNGMSPSDMSLDEYFAIAEKLDMPVGIHMGTGGNGMTNISGSKYRAAMGNALLLEDLLHRHPKLRVWVQHAGYPLVDELIALMGCNAYVFVDLSGFIWSYPLEEINATIKHLIQAGFEKRLMYGTDFMAWPKMIEASIGVIQNASYLAEEQKRDILYNNAARFLRIDEIKK
jgi:predicted TIM-barrel fold metal-dependent hydrolase